MKTQIGTAITGDFEDNTMTFEIEGAMVLAAGKYAIVPIEDYDKLVKNNVVLDHVSNCKCNHSSGTLNKEIGKYVCDKCQEVL
jgi:hypothetical protein